MKIIFSILLFISAHANAQGWILTEITSNRSTVGFVYHTHAVGINGNEKVVAGLRFICSKMPNIEGPIIAIHWDKDYYYPVTQEITLTINKKVVSTGNWIYENNIFYQPLSQNKTLPALMKDSRTIGFSWSVDNLKHNVVFDIRDFDLKFNNFLSVCKIEP